MTALIVISLVLSFDPLFRWVDAEGGVHYTNDAHSIPTSASAVTTNPVDDAQTLTEENEDEVEPDDEWRREADEVGTDWMLFDDEAFD